MWGHFLPRDNLQIFLSALRCPRRAPSLDFLNELIRSHLAFFPYESGSKLLFADAGKRRLPTLDEYLDGNVEFGFGGTCFAQNSHFVWLLTALGFEADLIGVTSGGKKNSHVSCRVRIEEENYIVDLGLMSIF